MHDFEKRFVDFLIREKVLQFGRFKLKDGRSSPYFLNFGLLNLGRQIHDLGRFFAEGIDRMGIRDEFEVLFGPAYKGIAIAAAAASALHADHGVDRRFAYNRKEEKGHGEGGLLVGLPPGDKARVLILDDVFSGGKAKDEALSLLSPRPELSVAGILVGVDRQEKTASGEVESEAYQRSRGVRIWSLASVARIGETLRNDPGAARSVDPEHLHAFFAYIGLV